MDDYSGAAVPRPLVHATAVSIVGRHQRRSLSGGAAETLKRLGVEVVAELIVILVASRAIVHMAMSILSTISQDPWSIYIKEWT